MGISPDVKISDWKFHPANLGEDCANMFAYDVDEDGDRDVISSSAHDYGIWWHEQKKDGKGIFPRPRMRSANHFLNHIVLHLKISTGMVIPIL